ncbi:MAG: hypothetical protein ABWX74_14525 [Aeromicrobium sp.]
MIDHSSDFDARRIGWWARRGAVRRIRRSAAITDADRELRMQQARAAQTRGEINALTRGLTAVVPPPATWTPPPAPPAAYAPLPPATHSQATYPPPPPPATRQPTSYAPPTPPAGYQPTPPASLTRSFLSARRLLVGFVVVLLACGGGVVSCVSSIVDSVQDLTSESSTTPPDLATEEGWTEMVDGFDAEADLSQTVGLIVRPRSATLSVRGDGALVDRFYFDGDVTSTAGVRRDPVARDFDPTQIAPGVPGNVLASARRSSGVSDSTQALMTISSRGSGVQLVVTFPDGSAGTYVMVADAEGNVVSVTP